MNSSLKRQLLRTLSKMLSDLKNPKEIELFLTDFFDDNELEKYIKRLAVAYWLKKGRDVENIKTNLEASVKEITETEKLLKTNGLKLAIKNIEADEWANVWDQRIKKFTKD
ncbi:MAG TPA: Trp family transcriptional regulator [Patescibacteria group bacterium]|nr:Trp family transcriptional regulator [Patescibacteria group bacterium]